MSLQNVVLYFLSLEVYSVQFSSVTQSCLTLCNPMDCSMTGFLVHHQLPKLTETHVHWIDNTIQPSHPLFSPSLPAFNLSQHQGLFWVSSSHDMAKVLEFHFTISPSNDYSGLISFMIDWFDFLAVQRTPQSLLQYHSSKASILLQSAFSVVQLLQPYITTRKTMALSRCTFVSKVMSLLFNTLSRLVIDFLPSSKCL